ncbi:hypothetical protein L1987_44540 [Smallanthus sonchifolius]|uniref:Uncharacterized protein n=1 Tax=Smallanthus sonchifolius TaxID=185202 RepID=A0ACB9GPR1_9ASTR|nr:hypothetical protein L1987_44540 [Smallanthus sonchifolius]
MLIDEGKNEKRNPKSQFQSPATQSLSLHETSESQTTIPRLLDCFSLSSSSTVHVSAAAPPATGSASWLSQSTAAPPDSPVNHHLHISILQWTTLMQIQTTPTVS